MSDHEPIIIGGENVFADLGLAEADLLALKAELLRTLGRIIRERGLTQKQAAQTLSIDQPTVSALLAGKLSGFSLERLLRYLHALDYTAQLVIRPR